MGIILSKIRQLWNRLFWNRFWKKSTGPPTLSGSFLHGTLFVKVYKAEKLPRSRLFELRKDVDPFVVGLLDDIWMFTTRKVEDNGNPLWDEDFSLLCCHYAENLSIRLKDEERHAPDKYIGICNISCEEILKGETIEQWFELTKKSEREMSAGAGRIHLTIKFTPTAPKNEKHLDCSYFHAKDGNRVTLYQNAETHQLPIFNTVTFPDGSPYKVTRAWRDIYEAIEGAQCFVYMVGWCVYTRIQFMRGADDLHGQSHVGELLKRKANEGVRVLVMIWDERLSEEPILPGLMGTSDEDTYDYFEGSGVTCVKVLRHRRVSTMKDEVTSTMFSHHQKTVVCDAPMKKGNPALRRRRVIAFLGGIDVANGRYDMTAEFPLYSTLKTLHRGDFYSHCVKGVTKDVGPRQPWQDCHAKIEGPAAADVLRNFEDRWCKQVPGKVTELYRHNEKGIDLDLPAELDAKEGGQFKVQVFRSISSDSACFDLEKSCFCRVAKEDGLAVENSIMRAMVQAIRNAENFIYLENQYFYGSSFMWCEHRHVRCNHIVPAEIAQKICDKIQIGKTFRCYILVPMWPEGIPHTDPVQEILYWQRRTMEFMYLRIGEALRAAGSSDHPMEYLAFFCLAKREGPADVPGDLDEPKPNSDAAKVRASLRHPIYVHSKMSIYDDEYLIIGSANINQRSLDGNRDSEIAMGCWQPAHLATEGKKARGYIHTYRRALWASHFNGDRPEFKKPNSRECMAKVRQITRGFWEEYTAATPRHIKTNMLPYPLHVDRSGRVGPLPEPWDCFPDTKAPVMGRESDFLPDKLTT